MQRATVRATMAAMRHNHRREPIIEEDRPEPGMVLLGLLLTAGLLGLEVYLLAEFMPGITAKGWAIAAALTLAYVVLGSILRPEPDTSDLGWFGGLVDNPFSFRDDANRFLLFLRTVLLPARLASWSVLSALRLLR